MGGGGGREDSSETRVGTPHKFLLVLPVIKPMKNGSGIHYI